MSQHRPYAVIQIDIFPDERFPDDVEVTDKMLAEAAWSDVKDWVANGYEPVIEVVTDDHSCDVDLEDHETPDTASVPR